MPLNHLSASKPHFYASIASFLPLQDQLSLARASKECKNLVSCANTIDFNALKVSRVYENCKEQIEQFNGPWHKKKEAKEIIPYAIPIIDRELKNSCKSLGIPEFDRFFTRTNNDPLTMLERAKIATFIDNKNAKNLVCFFENLPLTPSHRESLQKIFKGDETEQEKAGQIREWMQSNEGALSHITKLEQIGGEAFYFGEYHVMPSEVLLLTKLGPAEVRVIIQKSLEYKCPFLIAKIIKDPRLFRLPTKWLGALFEQAVAREVLPFVKAFLDSEKFADIPDESLIKGFKIASQNHSIKMIQAFLFSPGFLQMPQAPQASPSSSVQDYTTSARYEDKDSINSLLTAKRAPLIPYRHLQAALEAACKFRGQS